MLGMDQGYNRWKADTYKKNPRNDTYTAGSGVYFGGGS